MTSHRVLSWNYTDYSFSSLNGKIHLDCTCYKTAAKQGWTSEK